MYTNNISNWGVAKRRVLTNLPSEFTHYDEYYNKAKHDFK